MSDNEEVEYSKASHHKKSYFPSYIKFGVSWMCSLFFFKYTKHVVIFSGLHKTVNVKTIKKCFSSWSKLRSEAAIAKCSGKYLFLDFNNPISNNLNSGQNSWKILPEKSIFIEAVGLQPEMLLKMWVSPRHFWAPFSEWFSMSISIWF